MTEKVSLLNFMSVEVELLEGEVSLEKEDIVEFVLPPDGVGLGFVEDLVHQE